MKRANHVGLSSRAFAICLVIEPEEESLFATALDQIFKRRSEQSPVLVICQRDSVEKLKRSAADLLRELTFVPSARLNLLHSIFEELPENLRGHDLLILRPGLELPECWDGRLRWAAYADDSVATVSPLCDDSPVFALVNSSLRKREVPVENLNRLAYWRGEKKSAEVPFFLDGCAYLKRAALDQLDSKQSEDASRSEWPWRISHQLKTRGFLNVIASHIYIRGGQKTFAPKEVPGSGEVEVARILKTHPLVGLREAAQQFISRGKTLEAIPGISERTVQLHVMHGWGGGLEHWVETYCRADTSRTNLILKPAGNWGSFGESLFLFDAVDAKKPVASWDFTQPIRATSITHLEYKRALEQIIEKFGVDYIIVSSLIGHSLDLLTTGVDTAIVCHDYYPLCPAINIHFNGVCSDCGKEKLTQCFRENEFNRFFRNVSAPEWLPLRNRFSEIVRERSIPLIAPSESIREHMTQLQPALQDAPFFTLAHGMNSRKPVPFRKQTPGGKLRVVVLGSLALQKGHQLFKAAYRDLLNFCEIYLVGCGPEGQEFEGAGIQIILRYQQEELPQILEKISPDCGLLLSVWPETFSYTLSELGQFGIPPLATNLGAFKNKIQHGTTGLLFEPTPHCLVQALKALRADSTPLEKIRENLQRIPHRSLQEMVGDYHKLLPEKKFSAQRYAKKPAPHELKGQNFAPPKPDFKTVVRQQMKTPTLRAMKKRVVRWFTEK